MTDLAYTARIEAHRANLSRLLAERVDPLDLPGHLTQREKDSYVMVTNILRQQHHDFEAAVAEWASLPSDGADSTWLTQLTWWQSTLETELASIQLPIRDAEVKLRHERLIWSIRLIDNGLSIAPANLPIVDLAPTPIGALMSAAGYEIQGEALRGPRGFLGSMAEVTRRIKALDKQRSIVKKSLDELLTTDEERTSAEAADKKFSAILRSMVIKNNFRGDGHIAETLDGNPLPLESMTAEQRDAFLRFERAAFPPKETADV